jgi:aspartate kinase
VVVVVSAMGHQTDILVDLAKEISDRPSAREMDMLLSTGEQVSVALFAMAVQAAGHKAVSLTGAQIGIRTDSTHGKARIRSISTDHVKSLLDAGADRDRGRLPGHRPERQHHHAWPRRLRHHGRCPRRRARRRPLRDLHRRGRDLHDRPRLLPDARRLGSISYDEMLELASLGAGVMHSRSIEFAKKFGVKVVVRSSFKEMPGTLILAADQAVKRPVSGVALAKDEARITLEGAPDQPGSSHALFSALAESGIAVDMIVQNVGQGGRADISFTVPEDDLADALERTERVAKAIGADGVSHDHRMAKVSVVGVGMEPRRGWRAGCSPRSRPRRSTSA